MLSRVGLAAGALLLASALPAAAVKPVCHVIPDARGDEGLVSAVPLPLPGTAADDLLSADVASDGRTLTVALRMADLPTTDPVAPLGRQYQVAFRLGQSDVAWFVRARTSPLGTTFSFGRADEVVPLVFAPVTLGVARGVVDEERREVRINAPGKAFGLRRGSKLVQLRATVDRVVGYDPSPQPSVGGVPAPTSQTFTFDAAEGRPYVVGTPSCLRVGA